jgi:hypothetical protein
MSFVNLVGNLVTPSYDALYLVNCPILEEAREAGGIFVRILWSIPRSSGEFDSIQVLLSNKADLGIIGWHRG